MLEKEEVIHGKIRGNMGLRAVTRYFPGIKWIIRRQYASHIPLHPISGQYPDYMPAMCRQYMAYLPFTGNSWGIHGPLYYNSTGGRRKWRGAADGEDKHSALYKQRRRRTLKFGQANPLQN